MEQYYDVAVIGGGAAGCIAAGKAAEMGKKVCLIEKNQSLGRKVAITGKGRCNVTNNCTPSEFIENVKTGGKFLYSAINRFSPQNTMEFFESLGVALKTERGARVFPESDKAADIVAALKKYVQENKVTVINRGADEILADDGEVKGVRLGKDTVFAESIIIATGGKSYPRTGSTGDGYRFAKQLGHKIITPRAALVPLESPNRFCSELSGLSLKNVTLSLICNENGKTVFSELGEMLFTHFGISGPLVLSASSHITDSPEKYYISIDLKPGLSFEKLDERILRDFKEFLNRDISNALFKLLPKSLVPVVLKKAGIPPETKVNHITKAQRTALVCSVKDFKVQINKFRPIDEAIVTSGGVSTDEINPKTMQSKLVKNLYFAGEVINVDAYTGGFNLQIAFSTGYLAGNACT